MPKYRVVIQQTEVLRAAVKVEASNCDVACKEAIDMDDGSGDVEWQTEDVSDIAIYECEELPDEDDLERERCIRVDIKEQNAAVERSGGYYWNYNATGE